MNTKRTLAVRVTILAVTVGAVVAAAAAVSGAGSCGAPSGDPVISGSADIVCYHLVRTLAERVGIATGVVTAILTLTVIGLSRLVSRYPGSQLPDRPS